MRSFEVQQNLMVRLCLNKKYLIGSSNINYIKLNILPVRFLYKQFAILYESNKLEKMQVINTSDIRAYYDINVWYTKKDFGKHFIDYLGPTMYNYMLLHITKNIFHNFYKKLGYLCNKKIIFNNLLENLNL